MAYPTGKGGNPRKERAASKVEFTRKSALALVPVPKAPAHPEVAPASSMEEALAALQVAFQLKLRRLDGSTEKETVAIRSMQDFEEEGIIRQSAVLQEQKIQMDFLHDFQNELSDNPVLREEMQELLNGEKKEQFVHWLKGWSAAFRKRDPEFLKLLRP